MNAKRFFGSLMVSAIALSPSATCVLRGQGIEYSITRLGNVGGDYFAPQAINRYGQIVGWYSTNTNSGAHAALYSAGKINDLGTLGGTNSYTYGINDQGQVVGASYLSNGQSHAFFYSNGVMNDLGSLGGTASEARGINNKGQIACSSWTGNFVQGHAYLYDHGVMTDLGSLGGQNSYAISINDNGDVAGISWPSGTNANKHAFLYSAGIMSDLGTLGGWWSDALGMNNQAQVVGDYYSADGLYAFLYRDGTMNSIGSLGHAGSSAYAINNSGQVVGTAATTNLEDHAFIYYGGLMTDLNTLVDPNSGWTLVGATAISDNGQIVGVGYHPTGVSAGFLLTPLLRISATGSNAVVLHFIAQANAGYVIEYRDSLTTGSWQAWVVLDPITILHPVDLTMPIPADKPVRFYRVRRN